MGTPLAAIMVGAGHRAMTSAAFAQEHPDELRIVGGAARAGSAGGGHGGGKHRLMRDFLRVLRNEEPSIAATPLADSISGHLIGFSAVRAREGRCMVTPLGPKGVRRW